MSTFNYDTLNRLTTGEGGFGVREYDYDLNGNRLRLDDGGITDYQYSVSTNRLLSKTGWQYTTDGNGSVTGKIDSAGEGSIYKYNSHNRMTMASARTIKPAKGKNKQPVVTDTVVGTYTYNALGQQASKNAEGVTTKFLYGMEGALLAETDVAGEPRREYIFLNNELLAVLNHKASSSTEPANVIVDNVAMTPGWIVKTSNKDYGSDYLYSEGGSGDTVRWIPMLGPGDYEVYVWYVRNRKYSDSVPYTVSHDGHNETVTVDQSTGGGGWLLIGGYYFNGDGSEYVEVSDATGKTTADAVRFVKTRGGPASTATTLSYVHNDHLGTPQVMTDETGNEVWRAVYDPFGKATVDLASTVDMNVRFPGQYYDSETGCHYNYFRYYCPDIGRYITADKLDAMGRTNDPQLAMLGFVDIGWFEFNGKRYYDTESGASTRLNHPYGYANQNPLNWIDPFGLEVNYWSGNTRSDVSLGDSISGPNGNLFSGFTPQDWKCSSIACLLNPFPPMMERCINHDQCYEDNLCNSSSWISTVLGGTKSCNQCNSDF
jgi:RHS repeat-associated protein